MSGQDRDIESLQRATAKLYNLMETHRKKLEAKVVAVNPKDAPRFESLERFGVKLNVVVDRAVPEGTVYVIDLEAIEKLFEADE